jgi:hypothetical protein
LNLNNLKNEYKKLQIIGHKPIIDGDLADSNVIWVMPIITLFFILFILPFSINPVHWKPIIIAFLVSIAFASLLQVLWKTFQSLGAAFTFLFSLLFILGFFPNPLTPLIPYLALLPVLYSLYSLRKISFKQHSFVLISGALFSLILIHRSEMSYAQPFMALHTHKDLFFHSAITSMIKNYGVASTGLSGLVPLHYHVGSHAIFAALSTITGLSTFDCYTYIYPLVFVPLILTTFLAFSEELAPSKNTKTWPIKVFFATFILLGLRNPIYGYTGFLPDYLLSESYTLGIISLIGLASLILKCERSITTKTFIFYSITMLLLFALTCFAKISVAFVFLGCLFSWIFLGRAQNIIGRFIISSLCGIVLLVLLSYTSKSVSAGSFQFLAYIKGIIVPFSAPPGVTLFLQIILYFSVHLMFSNIVIICAGILAFNDSWRNQFPLWLIAGIAFASAMGSVPGLLLDIPGGAASFFSNPPQLLSLSLILLLPAFIGSVSFSSIKSLPAKIKAPLLISATFLLGHFIIAFLPTIPKTINSAKLLVLGLKEQPTLAPNSPDSIEFKNRSLPALYRDTSDLINSSFYHQLKTIQKDDTTKNFLIYIPKNLEKFWSLEKCHTISLIIPALSERPALRGTPLPQCQAKNYGYEDYHAQINENNVLSANDDQTILAESKKLGFSGVIYFMEDNFRIIQ